MWLILPADFIGMRFNDLRVKKIIKETPDSVSIEFEVPEELKETYNYTPGQYLTIKHKINGEELRRSYSLCSAPFENQLKIAVKKVNGGKFSSFAVDQLTEGVELNVMKPMGRFSSAIKTDGARVLMIAAGSGITPVLSIMKGILKNTSPENVTLIYGNRDSNNVIFKNELDQLESQYDCLTVHHVLSREETTDPANQGRIDADKCEDLMSSDNWNMWDEIFICGPEAMIMNVKEHAETKGVDASKIKFELFFTAIQEEPRIDEANKEESNTSTAISHVTVIVDGEEFEFDLASDGQNILDAASDEGADVPFSCKAGVCCTCKAQVLEGEVHMEQNYALEPDDLERGFVLSCQAHPKTEKVVIDFDVI